EQVVGVLDLLEALLRRGVARVRVGMVLPGELAVGLLDLVLARALRDAERPVEVLNGRHRPPPEPRRPRARDARRGRQAGSPSARPRARSLPPPRRAARAAPRGRAGRTGRWSRSPPGPRAPERPRARRARGGHPLRASPPRALPQPPARARGRRARAAAPSRAARAPAR